MSNRITRADLEARFATLRRMAPELPWTHLTIGSKLNGNTFNLYRLDLPSHGHSKVVYIGWTTREAYDWLGAAIETVHAMRESVSA